MSGYHTGDGVDPGDDHQTCTNCGDRVYTLSSRGRCDSCEEETDMTTVDESTCPGPGGTSIPLLHFDNANGQPGKLAVSLADDGRAMFTTPAHPFDTDVTPIMLSREDRHELGRRLLADTQLATYDHPAGDVLAHGERITLDIPLSHPWMRWLAQTADHMPHGAMTIALAGILQRFDLTEVSDHIDYGLNTLQTQWRMCGHPIPLTPHTATNHTPDV
jgi:hypothetical protein